MTDWIFQGNPDRFDVDAYLRTHRHIYWTVTRRKHQEQVRPGDRVFLWRAAGSKGLISGIIALGVVVESPVPKAEVRSPEHLSEFLWSPDAREPSEVKAGIEVKEVRLSPAEGMLTRRDLLLHPILFRLLILRFAEGSNFPLTPEEGVQLLELWGDIADPEDLEAATHFSSPEGAIRYRLHRSRERDRTLVRVAKEFFVRRNARLYCEICMFDFERAYGPIGTGFIEAHHTKPISTMNEGEETSIDDLIMVCSNCHRMLHRGDPVQIREQLRARFAGHD